MELLFNDPKYQRKHAERLQWLAQQEAPLRAQLQQAQANGDAAAMSGLQHQQWLLGRMRGVTGSSVATLLNMNPWQTPYQLWCKYTGCDNTEQPQTDAQEWGHRLEPVIAQKYAELTGLQLQEIPMVQSPQYPFLVGSLDRVAYDKAGAPVKVVEIKTTAMNHDTTDTDEDGVALKAWGGGNQYGPNGELRIKDSQVPKNYLCQVMHYMILTGLQEADIAVLINTNTFRVFTVDYDAALAQAMIAAADRFWCLNVLDDVAPPALEVDVKAMPVNKGTEISCSPEVALELAKLKEVTAQRKALEAQEQQLRDAVLGFMGSNERLMDGDKCLATYSQCKGRASFNAKRFQVEQPDVYASYVEQGAPYRRFMIRK